MYSSISSSSSIHRVARKAQTPLRAEKGLRHYICTSMYSTLLAQKNPPKNQKLRYHAAGLPSPDSRIYFPSLEFCHCSQSTQWISPDHAHPPPPPSGIFSPHVPFVCWVGLRAFWVSYRHAGICYTPFNSCGYVFEKNIPSCCMFSPGSGELNNVPVCMFTSLAQRDLLSFPKKKKWYMPPDGRIVSYTELSRNILWASYSCMALKNVWRGFLRLFHEGTYQIPLIRRTY